MTKVRNLAKGSSGNGAFYGEGYAISFHDEDYEGPVKMSMRPEVSMLHLALPPVAYEGAMRFPEAGIRTLHRVGHGFFCPAHVLVESHGSGGIAHRMTCAVRDQRLASVLEEDSGRLLMNLDRGCDLDLSPVTSILRQIAAELRSPALWHSRYVDALLTQAIIELGRHMRGRADDLRAPGQLSQVQMAIIRDRLYRDDLPSPGVAELAAACGVSERHLLRLFRATTGDTISTFLHRELVARAYRLLSNESLPLKRIAYLLGFANPSSFSNAFRAAVGLTPGRYRASLVIPPLAGR